VARLEQIVVIRHATLAGLASPLEIRTVLRWK